MPILSVSEEAIDYVLEKGEFPQELRESAPRVLVIMTQDWCPQWQDMKRFLPEFQKDLQVYTLVYNLHPRFEQIRTFKEDVFGNREIPYLRYYFQGRLVTHTNWLPKRTFGVLLSREIPFRT